MGTPDQTNKLIRDRIPEIIARSGGECHVVTMSEDEFRQALRRKLVEEAQEAATAQDHDLLAELADLYEVVDALLAVYNIDRAALLAEQQQRRTERGAFTRRLRLLRSS